MSLQPPFLAADQAIITPEHQTNAESMRADFSMDDLNDVHSLLWLVGSLSRINSLHHQRVLLREVIPSESARLHLLWFDRNIYVKPLHDYLLNRKCYEDIICKDRDLHALVIGFVLSYTKLVQTPLDLAIARDLHLTPASLTWEKWSAFRQKVIENTKNVHVNKRYEYGELRLARLDLIWRFTGRGLTYFTVHREYKTYFDQYFALLIAVFAFVATILTAMQVVIGITTIPQALRTVCYRFSIAVMIGICLCFVYIGLVFLAMFSYNMFITRVAHKKHKSF